MTAQAQAAAQKSLASVPTASEHSGAGHSVERVVPAVPSVLHEERSTTQDKRTPLWALSVTERRVNWLRTKHPKMNVRKRDLWTENAQRKTAPSCSR